MTDTRKEADMGYVKDVVGLLAQALVDATELPKQMEAIRTELTILTGDLERTKTRNIELDTLLSDTRRQRDEAEQALSQARTELSISQNQTKSNASSLLNIQAECEQLKADLAQARKDRDAYGLEAMSANDRANEAEAKLDKLREAMGLPKPQPEAPKPEPIHPVSNWGGIPQAMPEPTPNPTPLKRIYEGEFGFNELSMGTEAWDNVSQRYYRTA